MSLLAELVYTGSSSHFRWEKNPYTPKQHFGKFIQGSSLRLGGVLQLSQDHARPEEDRALGRIIFAQQS